MKIIKRILNFLYYILRNPRKFVRFFSFWRIASKSPYFNSDYYEKTNLDVKGSNIFPLLHFHEFGWHEKRNPSFEFNIQCYLVENKDVADSNINPLLHYIKWGRKEGRQIKNAAGETRNSAVSANNINPQSKDEVKIKLLREGGIFDEDYYMKTNPDIKTIGIDAATHFYYFGYKEGREPCPNFNWQFYGEYNS
jgi:hypothetical protein